MKIKCPKCGSIFEGPVQFCPSCGAKLAMPEGQPAPAPAPAPQAAPAPAPAPAPAQQPQVVYVQAAPQAAPAPAPREGSKGKAIGMSIASLLLGLPSLVLEICVTICSVLGSMMCWGSYSGDLLDNEFWAVVAAFGWAFVLALFVPMLLAFIFGIIAGKQKKVKGLAIPAMICGILGFVLFFGSLISCIVGLVAGIAGVVTTTTI